MKSLIVFFSLSQFKPNSNKKQKEDPKQQQSGGGVRKIIEEQNEQLRRNFNRRLERRHTQRVNRS